MAYSFSPYLTPVAVIFAAAALSPAGASALPAVIEGVRQVADIRTYRHCHNTPRRTYCHTREHLPVTIRPHPDVPKDPHRD